MGFSADNYFSGKSYLNNIDLNTLKVNGVYYSASAVSNIPASGFNGMIVVFNFSQFIAQIAFNAYSGTAYIRANLYGSGGWNTWSSWRQI